MTITVYRACAKDFAGVGPSKAGLAIPDTENTLPEPLQQRLFGETCGILEDEFGKNKCGGILQMSLEGTLGWPLKSHAGGLWRHPGHLEPSGIALWTDQVLGKNI